MARTPTRNPAFNRAMSRGSDSTRKSMSKRLSGDADSRTRPPEYDLFTQKPTAPMRRPTACHPPREAIATCMSPGGVPSRPEEYRSSACR